MGTSQPNELQKSRDLDLYTLFSLAFFFFFIFYNFSSFLKTSATTTTARGLEENKVSSRIVEAQAGRFKLSTDAFSVRCGTKSFLLHQVSSTNIMLVFHNWAFY